MNQQIKTGLGVVIILIMVTTAGLLIWLTQKNQPEIVPAQTQVQNKATKKQAESATESLNYCDKTFTTEKVEIDGIDIVDKILQLYIAQDKNNCINFEQIENIGVLRTTEESTIRIILYESRSLAETDKQLSPDKQLEKIFSNENYPQVNEFRISDGNIYTVSLFDGSSRLLGKMDTITNSDWQTYRNEMYGFEFKYPQELIVKTGSNKEYFSLTVTDEPEGHWIYEVRFDNKGEKKSESDICKDNYGIYGNINETNIDIDGHKAKYCSIIEYGDYGNAMAVVISNNGIFKIFGDDSTAELKEKFHLILSTFKFIK